MTFDIHGWIWNQFQNQMRQSDQKMLRSLMVKWLKAKIFSLGQWYNCRGTAVVANSGVWLWGLRQLHAMDMKCTVHNLNIAGSNLVGWNFWNKHISCQCICLSESLCMWNHLTPLRECVLVCFSEWLRQQGFRTMKGTVHNLEVQTLVQLQWVHPELRSGTGISILTVRR